MEAHVSRVKEVFAKAPDMEKLIILAHAEYDCCKYIRGDNTPENATYLGYLDARELYPDFKPVKFREYFTEVKDGKAADAEPYDVSQLRLDKE